MDDGSNDGSLEFVKNFPKESKEFKLIQNSHTGKAGAVTAGMLESKGDYVLFMDMDQATPIEEIGKLLPYANDFDIVIGSRNTTRKGAPFTRKIMGTGMIVLRTFLVGLPNIKDTQCGFKAFTEDAAERIFSRLTITRWGFDVEVLAIAKLLGYKIKEVGITWVNDTRSHVKASAYLKVLLEVIKIRFNLWRKVYHRASDDYGAQSN